MNPIFLTNLDEKEFKEFLKGAVREVLSENLNSLRPQMPEILDMKQASELLHLKITTIYEKTSCKQIPHFKKGNKLFFNRTELEAWVKEGKVKTMEEIQGEAADYLLKNKRKW